MAVLIASLAASQMALDSDPAQAFYLLPYRAWELLLGALLAVASLPAMPRLAANVAGLSGFAAIAYAAAGFDTATPFPGLAALLPCLGAALLIGAGANEPALSRSILGFGPLRFVGKISYSLYLIHWPLFSFAHIALDGEPGTRSCELAIVAAECHAGRRSPTGMSRHRRAAQLIRFPGAGAGCGCGGGAACPLRGAV